MKARAAARLEWQAGEALPSPMKMTTLAVDNRVVTEG
jgi:hypothetical protein